MSQHIPKMPFEAGRPEDRGGFTPRAVPEPLRFVPGSPDTPGQTSTTSSSLTYEPYYGLAEKAFSLSADPRFLYRNQARMAAFEELLTGIRRREGLIVLTGEIGTGKTTLIRSVLQHLDRRTFTAFVPDPFLSREDLLKTLLVDFGVVSVADLKRGSLAGTSRPDLSYPLYEFLDSLVPLQAFAVLIIDEAQNLPLPLLEEIRILSDLEHREKLLQVVLVGQPELRAHLKLPEMRQVDQRVSVRCEMSPLGLGDVAQYIRHRLNVASGGESTVEFSAAAAAAVFTGSGGVPRLINLICDRALQRGHQTQTTRIEPPLVAEAIKGLGLDVPTMPVASVTESRQARPTSNPDTATPVVVPVVRPSSVPVRDAEPRRYPPQVLSEFAAEADATERSGRRVRLWSLGAALAALTAVLCAALWSAYLVSDGANTGASALPRSPAWRTADRAAELVPRLDTRALDDDRRSLSQVSPPVEPAVPGRDPYAIQVASFESRARAERLVAALTDAGFRARAVEFDVGPTRGLLLQIRVDGYRSLEEAARDLTRIRALPGYADARLLYN